MTFFKKMQSVGGYSEVFSHLPHRDLLNAVLNYSRETSWILSSPYVLETVSRSWMVITTLYKRHPMQGVQFQTMDSKEITTSMQLSAQLKEIKIILHEPEEKYSNNNGPNDRCPQCKT